MRFRFLFGLGLLGTAAAASNPPSLHFAFEYGFGTRDYVDIGKAEPRSARMGHDSAARNLESFVILYRAERSFGDFVYRPSFFFSLDPLVLESAKGVKVWMRKIEKYPDLVRRYNAVRPTSVTAIVSILAQCSDDNPMGLGYSMPFVHFKIDELDFVYGHSRDGKHRAEPVVPLKVTDRVSLTPSASQAFTSKDDTTEEKLKKVFRTMERVMDGSHGNRLHQNVVLGIKWPDFEIEQIAKDYERYEKDGQKTEDDYAFLKDPPKESPYQGNDELARPVETGLKPGEVLEEPAKDGRPYRAAIRVNGKTVYESTNLAYRPAPINEKNTVFWIRLRDEPHYRLVNTRGKLVAYGGYSSFLKSGNDIIGVPNNPAIAYRTTKEYSGVDSVMTESEMERFKTRDRRAPEPDNRPSHTSDGKQILYLSFATRKYEFYRGERLTLDGNNQNVVSRETVYIAQ